MAYTENMAISYTPFKGTSYAKHWKTKPILFIIPADQIIKEDMFDDTALESMNATLKTWLEGKGKVFF